MRLRESGKTVYGLGLRKTPASLVARVRPVHQPGGARQRVGPGDGPTGADDPTSEEAPLLNLQSLLTKAINATAEDDGWTTLGAIGNHLRSAATPRATRALFGHTKLCSLVRRPALPETVRPATMQVALKAARKSAREAGRRADEEDREEARQGGRDDGSAASG